MIGVMFDKKENNSSAIQDFSQKRNPVFKLPYNKTKTVKSGSSNNYIYMIFGILGFTFVSVVIYMFISYVLTIKNVAQLAISVMTLVAIFLVAAILIKVIYPRKPIEKDGNEDDL